METNKEKLPISVDLPNLQSQPESGIVNEDSSQILGRSYSKSAVQFPDNFVTYLNDCYNLMEEVWHYKRTFEGVDEFWYRIYIEPAQRALQAKLAGKGNPKKKSRKKRKKSWIKSNI